MRRHLLATLSLLGLVLAVTPAAAANLESALNAQWKGRFVVVRVPIASDCAGFYNDNDAQGTRVTSKAAHRFAAGELAHVERVGVTLLGGRVDVFLDFAEQILDAHVDGPFTLYDPKSCKVQLKLAGVGKKSAAEAEQALAALLELHADAREAEASPTWNHRRRDPLPPDYERTLAKFQAWKATQVNAALQTRMSQAIDEAAKTNDRMRNDADYLDGFAAGVERVRDHYFGDCASLVDDSFFPDSERHKSETYGNGYADGQRLAYNLGLLRHLAACLSSPPP